MIADKYCPQCQGGRFQTDEKSGADYPCAKCQGSGRVPASGRSWRKEAEHWEQEARHWAEEAGQEPET